MRDFSVLYTILASEKHDELSQLIVIAGICACIQELRNKKSKETIYHIVRKLILLTKHGSPAVKEAALSCLNTCFSQELMNIAQAYPQHS